jgi:hypothetical protein
VFYRTPDADSATVAEVNKILEQKNINVTELVEWTTDHCQYVELIAPFYVAIRNILSPLNPPGK